MAVITESRCESRALPANGMKLPARIENLRDRALNEEWGEIADRAAMVEAVFEANRREPRKLQIARALEAVCEQMPVRIAEDELIIGKRTVRGYPEHEEAVAAGSAEPGYMIADYLGLSTRALWRSLRIWGDVSETMTRRTRRTSSIWTVCGR